MSNGTRQRLPNGLPSRLHAFKRQPDGTYVCLGCGISLADYQTREPHPVCQDISHHPGLPISDQYEVVYGSPFGFDSPKVYLTFAKLKRGCQTRLPQTFRMLKKRMLSHEIKKAISLLPKCADDGSPKQHLARDRAITNLRQRLNLPSRFQEVLSEYARYGCFDEAKWFLVFSSKLAVHARQAQGEWQLYVKIDGDTKREDLIKAWPFIERLQKRYQLSGYQLFRYKNYNLGKDLSEGKRPGSLVYTKKNLVKHRYTATTKGRELCSNVVGG